MLIIEQLSRSHKRINFDCGDIQINDFLKTQSNQASKKNYSKTHVLVDDVKPSVIVGFVTISVCKIDQPLQHKISLNYPGDLFGINMARMGVNKKSQGKQLSEILIYEAILKTHKISLNSGVQGLFLDAKTDQLVGYYEKYNFVKIPGTSRKMWMPISEINSLNK